MFISLYSDRIFIAISQTETFGTIVHAQRDAVLDGGSTYDTSILLGNREDPIPELAARQLCERITSLGLDLPVLLSWGVRRGALKQPTDNCYPKQKLSEMVDGVMGLMEGLIPR